MSTNRTPRLDAGRTGLGRRAFRAVAIMVTVAVATVTLTTARAPEAEAISDFDTELLSLINEYRAAFDYVPLENYAPLSKAALDWSTSVRTELDFEACGVDDVPHDTPENVQSQGTIAGTVSIVEHVVVNCGVVGILRPDLCGRICQGTPREKCNRDRDLTSALDQFCALVLDDTIRPSIEDPDLTHIGIGTISYSQPGVLIRRHQFTTVRLADFGATCDGLPVTVNLITGQGRATNGDDVILGTDRGDRIYGYGGHDVICAGAGVDRIFGGPGNDRIFGEGGSDRIFAQEGWDTVYAGSGADRVWGGPGNDTLFGQGGKDFMWGDAGNDNIQGNHQTDKLWGGDGDDVLRGAAGKDKMWGDAGNDELFGGFNTDYLNGGPGTDYGHGQQGRDNPLVPGKSGCEQLETMISC